MGHGNFLPVPRLLDGVYGLQDADGNLCAAPAPDSAKPNPGLVQGRFQRQLRDLEGAGKFSNHRSRLFGTDAAFCDSRGLRNCANEKHNHNGHVDLAQRRPAASRDRNLYSDVRAFPSRWNGQHPSLDHLGGCDGNTTLCDHHAAPLLQAVPQGS